MGNVLSDDNEYDNNNGNGSNRFLEDGFNLDSPDADQKINYGTAAPIWQNKKAIEQEVYEEQQQLQQQHGFEPTADDTTSMRTDGGKEVLLIKEQLQQQQKEKEEDGIESSSSSRHTKHRHDSGLSDDGGSGGGATAPPKKQQRQNSTQSTDSSLSQQQQQQQQNPKKMSYLQMAKIGYQELVNAIIRPPRCDYKMEALGPPAFNFCGKRFTRTDFTLRTKRGYNLECSHWEPVERTIDRIPVIIYMHGNSSARLEVIPQLSYLLSLGMAVFAFDFAGSGKSDGEYVSLGYYEREDLSCVVAHLRATNVVSTIALWGRSMGAATALMFGDRDPSIACMILDSPFADLTLLCEEMVEKARQQGIVVPGLVVSIAIRMLTSSVKKQAGFNIKNISPISHADKCFIPALFVAGEHDDFIQKHHSEALHEKYAGDKNLIIVEGDHNSPRPKFMFDSASIFLQTCLQIPNEWALDVPVSMNLMCPPWFFELYEQRSIRRRQQQQQQTQQQNGTATKTTTTTTTSSAAAATSSSSMTATNNNNNNNNDSSSKSLQQKQLAMGFDHEEMGMTAERQRIIQASLFKMLGQADTLDDGTEDTNNNTSSSKPPSRTL